MKPDDDVLEQMFQAALTIGPVEWGATAEKPAEDHAKDMIRCVDNTAASFNQEGDQSMHGVYIAGSEIVICHTGTSPNSPTHARILTALWNRFIEEAEMYMKLKETTQ